MHISLLANIIEKLLRKKLGEERTFKLTSLLLIIYILLVGLSPSILRGVLFYILFRINKIYYFYIKPINLFIIILSISLLINPNYIFDIGFIYSFLISFSLIMLSDKLTSNNYFISLLKVSVISSLVSIPISLYNFYQINILSIIYNIFYVPLVSIIIFPFSLITGVFTILEPIYNLSTKLLEITSLYLMNINIGKLIFKRLPIFIYITYFLLIIFFIIRRKKIYLYVFFILMFIHYLIPIIDRTNYVEFIDVGQGDSILIHINNKNILLDTGGKVSYKKNTGNIFYNTIYPLLKSKGIKKINYMIITHGDMDHIGEAETIIKNFKVEKVIFNCGEYNNLENNLIELLDEKNISHYSCIEKISIGANNLMFLNTKDFNNENNNSIVLYTKINNYNFLFMGDASSTTEKEILNKYNLPKIDILKVGHHGSNTSSSKDFISKIEPKYSIISVGEDNRYNHPNKETLEVLNNSKIYRTDQNGSVLIKLTNNKLKIEASIN